MVSRVPFTDVLIRPGVSNFDSVQITENGRKLMLIRIVTRLGLKNSRILLAAYRKYISVRYKNRFNQFIKFRGFEIKVGKDLSLFPSLMRGDFEHEEMRMLSRIKLEPEIAIWDIGANVGVYSIFFAKTFQGCKIVSFEPSKSTFELLKQNLFHNKCDQVLAINYGLGQSTQSQILFKSSHGAGSNSIVLQEGPQSTIGEEIKMTTIDGYISNYPDLAPKLIKVDVEGYEPKVIMGGELFIKSQKPIIMMEVFPLLWSKNAYIDWKLCLDFLFSTYGEGLELRNQSAQLISSLSFEKNLNQRTLFFGLKGHI